MQETGKRNPSLGIETTGLKDLAAIHFNLTAAELCEEAMRRGEAKLTAHGALVAYTAPHTGRSPKDKYIVRDSDTSGKVWWDNNKPMSGEVFERLYADFIAHAAGRELFAQDLVGGADPACA